MKADDEWQMEVWKICMEFWYGWSLPPMQSASGRRKSEWMDKWNWKELDT